MNAFQSSPFLSWLLSYLFNALWQIPLVFAASWFATRMLRRTHPRVEHRVWVGALLLQVALPACSFRLGDLWHTLLSPFPSTGAANAGNTRVIFGPATAVGSMLRLPLPLESGIILAWACGLLYFAGRLAWASARPAASRAPQPLSRSPAMQHYAAPDTAINSESSLRYQRLPSPHRQSAR